MISLKNILVAPDKFKGSLTAREVCEAVCQGLLAVDASLSLVSLPMADGGEGSSQLLTSYSEGSTITVPVRDPLGRRINASYGISKDGKVAFLEMAVASGLQLLKHGERNPLKTSTLGTGDLIRHVLHKGVEQIVMGIGGSATNDAGMGMAEALGVKFYSSSGERLNAVGENLIHVHTIDRSEVDSKLHDVAFTLFCDVDNPLHGPNGAAYVFAPQKGADETMVRDLDAGLLHYEKILQAATGIQPNFPGAGAGGGLPATLKALANVSIEPGMKFIIEFIRLEERVRAADLVITGEGKIDVQTLSGKVVKGISEIAKAYQKPVIAVAGKCELGDRDLASLSLARLVTLVDERTSELEATENAFSLIRERVQTAFADLKRA